MPVIRRFSLTKTSICGNALSTTINATMCAKVKAPKIAIVFFTMSYNAFFHIQYPTNTSNTIVHALSVNKNFVVGSNNPNSLNAPENNNVVYTSINMEIFLALGEPPTAFNKNTIYFPPLRNNATATITPTIRSNVFCC